MLAGSGMRTTLRAMLSASRSAGSVAPFEMGASCATCAAAAGRTDGLRATLLWTATLIEVSFSLRRAAFLEELAPDAALDVLEHDELARARERRERGVAHHVHD